MKKCLILTMTFLIAIPLSLGCGQQGDKTVAKVNGEKIPLKDLEFSLRELSARGGRVDEQTRKRAVEEMIYKEVLVQEAERLGISKDPFLRWKIEQERERVLIEELIRRQVKQFALTTDEEVAKFYQEVYSKKAPKPLPFDQVKDRIRLQLNRRKEMASFNTLAKELRGKASVSVDEKVLNSIAPPGR